MRHFCKDAQGHFLVQIPLHVSPVGTPERGEPAARGLNAPEADCGRARCSPSGSLSATVLTCQRPACMQMNHDLVC